MIIKNVKSYFDRGCFADLHRYITRKSKFPALAWNLVVNPEDSDAVIQQFRDNAKLLQNHWNGSMLRQEVVSLKDTGAVPREQLLEILREITSHWIEKRAPNLLVYGRVHCEPENVHYHLLLSSNQVGESKRYRLAKALYAELQVECERFAMERFPQLGLQPIYHKPAKPHFWRRSDCVGSMVADILTQEMMQPSGDYIARLRAAGFEFYEYGTKSHGVVWAQDGKKYRFRTLGLYDQLLAVQERQQRFLDARAQIQLGRARVQRSHLCDHEGLIMTRS